MVVQDVPFAEVRVVGCTMHCVFSADIGSKEGLALDLVVLRLDI